MSTKIGPLQKHSLMKSIGAESLEIKKYDEIITPDTITFPVADIASLGTAFSGLSAVFSVLSKATQATGDLYEAIFPVDGGLAKAKDGSGYLGTIINKDGIAGQARFRKVGHAADVSGGVSTIFMAAALMAINYSLKNIAENQKEILGFLETDKQTQLKGDLNILTEIINDYQFNWDNSQWLSNRETQVLDIKRSAEQNILFYREMIEKKIGTKKQFIQFDTNKSLSELQSRFKYYQLSLYLYSFSSFLDIMLLKNFDSNYLDSIRNKIELYDNDYNSFFDSSIEGVQKIATSSIQSRTLQGLSITGKFLGNQLAKLPDKNNKHKLGSKLLSGSDKLDEFKEKSVNETTDAFSTVRDNGIKMFEDRISLINRLHNEPLKLYVGTDNLYLSPN
ncbi:MAG: hypothetical protein K5647_07075 [Clostridiales bacterium]|nr:hypothetical protein [Clostridiales bacterium]